MKLTGKNYLQINPNDYRGGGKGITRKNLENFFIEFIAEKYGQKDFGFSLDLDDGFMRSRLYDTEKNEVVLNKMFDEYEEKIKESDDDDVSFDDLEWDLPKLLLEDYFGRKIEEVIAERSYDYDSFFYVIFE